MLNIGPTPHAENTLIAYLPEQGIIFEADHFPQPANGVIPPAVPVTAVFAKRLDELNLDYTRLVGAHSPRVATQADVKKAIGLKGASSVGGQH